MMRYFTSVLGYYSISCQCLGEYARNSQEKANYQNKLDAFAIQDGRHKTLIVLSCFRMMVLS